MVERLRAVVGQDWAKSFVNSLSTVLLGLLVAWVTGFLELKSTVSMLSAASTAQTLKLHDIEVKIDERAKEFNALQLGGSVADSQLRGDLNVMKSQHEMLMREVEVVKGIVERRQPRSSNGH